MGEFDFIEKYLAPLAEGAPGALGLKDDAALIAEGRFIITNDAMAAGVHFFPDDSPEIIAGKLIRTNLSDIAAMGATPKFCLIAGCLSNDTGKEWQIGFASGMKHTLKEFGLFLIGGDTIRHNGPTVLSCTMIGETSEKGVLKRSGAKVGDDIYVSGDIGAAALGLKYLKKQLDEEERLLSSLVKKYHIPEPRIRLGQKLPGIANSAIDISDGLMADLSHICKNSNVGATIYQKYIPLSDAARHVLEKQPDIFTDIITGGDDYELLFTAPANNKDIIEALAQQTHTIITKIGHITDTGNVDIIGNDGNKIELDSLGYTHD